MLAFFALVANVAPTTSSSGVDIDNHSTIYIHTMDPVYSTIYMNVDIDNHSRLSCLVFRNGSSGSAAIQRLEQQGQLRDVSVNRGGRLHVL